MKALNDRQRAFVIAMLDTGGKSQLLAAKSAGYNGNDNTLGVTGHRLSHDPKVLAAIREEADNRLRSGAILASSVLMEIAEDPMHKDRMKAAVELLNRSGLLVANLTRHEVEITDTRDRTSILQRIEEIAQRNGLDATKFLTAKTALARNDFDPPNQIIDAAYEEVPLNDAGRDGLEDLL